MVIVNSRCCVSSIPRGGEVTRSLKIKAADAEEVLQVGLDNQVYFHLKIVDETLENAKIGSKYS